MKINIKSKNFKTGDTLNSKIEKKLEKLDKYFSDDITADVMIRAEANKEIVEATIKTKAAIFRAEQSGQSGQDIMESVDKVVDKLSSQMSRFKTKLQKKNKDKDSKEIFFAAIPEPQEEEEIKVVKTKSFDLAPMSVEEAILQMELLQHNFYVFINADTDNVAVVYERNDGAYGLLETK